MSANIIINENDRLYTSCPEYFMEELEKYTGWDLHRGIVMFDKRNKKGLRAMYNAHKNHKEIDGSNPYKQLLEERNKRKTLFLRCQY